MCVEINCACDVVSYAIRTVVCRLPMDAGPCGDRYDRWHFDVERSTCMPFIYGGCAGNMNRFKSFESCISFCSPPSAASRPSAPPSNPYGLIVTKKNSRAQLFVIVLSVFANNLLNSQMESIK